MPRVQVICKWGDLYEMSKLNLFEYPVHFGSSYKEETSYH